MSQLGQFQTSDHVRVRSVHASTADMRRLRRHVCFVREIAVQPGQTKEAANLGGLPTNVYFSEVNSLRPRLCKT
jgi:hypothetical protein